MTHNKRKNKMTKQQIVAQLVAAKIVYSGVIPHKDFLEQCGMAADKIIEMFPEPDYTVTIDNTTYACAEGVLEGLDNPNSTVSKALARNFNLRRTS